MRRFALMLIDRRRLEEVPAPWASLFDGGDYALVVGEAEGNDKASLELGASCATLAQALRAAHREMAAALARGCSPCTWSATALPADGEALEAEMARAMALAGTHARH